MHEMGIMKSVVKASIAAAQKNGVNRIRTVTLQVGELWAFIPEWVQQYFDVLSKGSVAEGAKVYLESVPATGRCNICNMTFKIDIHNRRAVCPLCNQDDYQLLTGNELILKSIETE